MEALPNVFLVWMVMMIRRRWGEVFD